MSKLDIGSLEALCAIADHGGVTRAAARLALSQSAVSHKIKRLEASLGCALLDRTSSTSVFTREGEKLLILFENRVQTSDTMLFKEPLFWIKSPDLQLDYKKPVPFLAFDDECFYREWAMDAKHHREVNLETILTCSSTSGILSGVSSGLGVALISKRHVRPEFEVINEPFPSPPTVATVVRSGGQCRSSSVAALRASIVDELGIDERSGQSRGRQ